MAQDGPVVIAVDGGGHSDETLRWGLAEADLRGADAVLVHSWEEPIQVSAWGWYPTTGDWRPDVDAKRVLEEAAHRARRDDVPRRLTTRLLHGPTVPALVDASTDAQLLVVGAHSAPGSGRLGRVASHVATHAHAPVAVVRSRDAAHAPQHRPVVVGVDGSQASLCAARVAAREALLRSAPLVVLHARPTVADPYGLRRAADLPLVPVEQDDPAWKASEVLADELRDEHPGLQVSVEVVDDDPAHALVTRSRSAALAVVGCRGLGAFRGMLLGSVSHDVLRGAGTTVLVVRGEHAA